MNILALGQVVLFLVVLFILAQPLGRYLVAVLEKDLPRPFAPKIRKRPDSARAFID